jgi:hypothetical protein
MASVKYHNGKFPPVELDWLRLLPLIGPANAAVARYEGVLHGIPNVQVLLSPLTSQEAVLSSKIEGTQATLGEVLEFEASEDTATGEKRNDIQEVLNYRHAMRHAVTMLEKLPLSQRVIKETHKVLMQGVRGENKTPGKYRRIPNWIGQAGLTVEEARYVPPAANDVPGFSRTGKSSSMPQLLTSSYNWPSFMRSLKPSILSLMAMVVSVACWFPSSLSVRSCFQALIFTSVLIWKNIGTNTMTVCWPFHETTTGPAGVRFS